MQERLEYHEVGSKMGRNSSRGSRGGALAPLGVPEGRRGSRPHFGSEELVLWIPLGCQKASPTWLQKLKAVRKSTQFFWLLSVTHFWSPTARILRSKISWTRSNSVEIDRDRCQSIPLGLGTSNLPIIQKKNKEKPRKNWDFHFSYFFDFSGP